jgi:hypothetical protein
MRYDERQVYGLIAELRTKLGQQEQARLLESPAATTLQTRLEKARAKMAPLQAEIKDISKAATRLGLYVDCDREMTVRRSGSSNSIPDAAARSPRVRHFERLERKVRTAIVGGDRAKVATALEALIAFADTDAD